MERKLKACGRHIVHEDEDEDGSRLFIKTNTNSCFLKF